MQSCTGESHTDNPDLICKLMIAIWQQMKVKVKCSKFKFTSPYFNFYLKVSQLANNKLCLQLACSN